MSHERWHTWQTAARACSSASGARARGARGNTRVAVAAVDRGLSPFARRARRGACAATRVGRLLLPDRDRVGLCKQTFFVVIA